jgi:hypothetical protein
MQESTTGTTSNWTLNNIVELLRKLSMYRRHEIPISAETLTQEHSGRHKILVESSSEAEQAHLVVDCF